MEYSSRPRPTDLGELKADLIRNAAFVAYEGQKAKALTKWQAERRERRIIYVFDSDVIVAYCGPWISGPADDNFLGRGYGQVLPQKPLDDLAGEARQKALADERRRSEAVCWLLASHALQGAIEGGLPILQTRSHFEETLGVYETVKSRAGVETTVKRDTPDDRLNHDLDQTLRLINWAITTNDWPFIDNPGRFLSEALSRIQERDRQKMSRPVQEWDAFLALVRCRGMFELSEFRPSQHVFGSEQRTTWDQVCSDLRGGDHLAKHRTEKVHTALQEIIAPERYQLSRGRAVDDLLAVSDVWFANQQLGSLNSPIRVVLVTGDRKAVLSLAAAKNEMKKSAISGARISRFAFDHVLHLWAFVDMIVPKQTSGDQAHSSSDLFSGFLAFADAASLDTSERLVNYAIEGDEDLADRLRGQDIDQAYARWDEFSEAAANVHRHFLTDDFKSEQISNLIIKKMERENPHRRFDAVKLRALVSETMARDRDRTNVEFSEIGAGSIFVAHRRGVRNPPDLMFDSLKITNQIFKDLALPRQVFLNSDDFVRRFEQIADDCYQPVKAGDDDFRQECYLKYLVLGALFASANRWVVAEQHAESAISIVRRARELNDPIATRASSRKSNMSGREAYFLLAVAKRIRAKSFAAYAQSDKALAEARRCLAEDKREGSAETISPVRFDCEALALALGRYYHARHANEDSRCDLQANAVFLRARLMLEAEQVTPIALPASTKTSMATNLLQVSIVAAFREKNGYNNNESPPTTAEVVKASLDILMKHTNLVSELNRLLDARISQETGEPSPEMICSPLMVLYAVVAAALSDYQRIPWLLQNNRLDELFGYARLAVTEYDEWRFKMLKRFAERLVPARVT